MLSLYAMEKWLQLTDQVTRRANLRIGLSWALGCAFLLVLIWGTALFKIEADHKQLAEKSQVEAGLRASAYAEQLLRSVSQIDQLSMAIKYEWERRPEVRLDLEEQFRKGVYKTALYPVVIDAKGYAYSSTRNLPRGTYMGDLELFKWHQSNHESILLISPPTDGRGGFLGKKIVRFSRQLNKPNGEFDGVVLIAVEQNYLSAFHDASQLAAGDFISAHFVEGAMLVTKGCDKTSAIFYSKNPLLTSEQGSRIQPASDFPDHQARSIVWQKLADYPLVVVAGVNHANGLKLYVSTHSVYISIATMATLLLLSVSIFGAISQIRHEEQRVHDLQVQATFRLAVDAAHEAFYMIRPIYSAEDDLCEFMVEDCNERASEMSGIARNELIGKNVSDLYTEKNLEYIHTFLRRVLKDGFLEDDFHMPYGQTHAAGWFQRRGVLSGLGIAVTVRDVSEARQQAESLSEMARTDALTGLPNRHWLNDYLPSALERAGQQEQRLALLYIDLDNFKDINDALGHRAGDELLSDMSTKLRQVMRIEDHLARIGGDEFIAIVEDLDGDHDASKIAAKLIDAIAALGTDPRWRIFNLKASVGISLFPTDAHDVDTLLRAADIAMYEAKSQGKAQYRHYNEQFAQKIRDRISIEHALERAIKNDEFLIYYQPRADARTGQISCMEALIRWNHPGRGLLSPVEFIGVAEQTRLIVPMGELVVQKVCAQIAAWRDEGVEVKPVSINVSALQLKDDGLRLMLIACLRRYQLSSSLVAIELTESSMLDEDGVALEELHQLRELGIELEIDDFGTGYSSLSKLQSLDIDVVKIDQSFIRKLGNDSQNQALCETMVSIGRSLDITVVAEGVETVLQLRMLQNMGCDEVQGYLISKPVPPAKIPALIRTQFFEPFVTSI